VIIEAGWRAGGRSDGGHAGILATLLQMLRDADFIYGCPEARLRLAGFVRGGAPSGSCIRRLRQRLAGDVMNQAVAIAAGGCCRLLFAWRGSCLGGFLFGHDRSLLELELYDWLVSPVDSASITQAAFSITREARSTKSM